MAGEDEKKVRTSAERKFTSCYNRLNEAILNKAEADIIIVKFKDLCLKSDDVQSKHDAYLFALHPEVEDLSDASEDTWLRQIEEKFDIMEKAKLEYLRSCELETKQSYEVNLQKEKNNQSTVLVHKRDPLKFMFTQELKGIVGFIEMDRGGVLKSQMVASMKDAKLQLERCKEAHLEYTSKVCSTGVEENVRIEDVYALYESCNRKVYTYLTTLSELELKQKRSLNVRMERIRMPYFDGDIRSYAKFKADF